jgi:parvulin-like peptidyl-prolyl isomerase
LAALLLAGSAACRRAPEEKAPSILIQVGESRLTTAEFESAWTAWSAAAGGDGDTEPQARQAERTRLLQELIEEMILLERARELGLGVDDAELAAAVAAVRKDSRRRPSRRCWWKMPWPCPSGRRGCAGR